jgi:methionyl-tRNA synthetase
MELSERMQKTAEGQLTWADPTLGKTCDQCKHCERHPKPREFKPDVCTLVKVHTGKIGMPFMARKAVACPKFSM